MGYDNFDSKIFTNFPKFNLNTDQLSFFFLKAMNHLSDEGMVLGTVGQPNPYYTITFKGLLSVYSGGFLKPVEVKKEDYNYKKILWWLAIATFCINTIFQVLNFAFKNTPSTNVSKDVAHVCVVHSDTISISKNEKVSTRSEIKKQKQKSALKSK